MLQEVLMDQKQETILNITDNAAEKVKTLMVQEGEEDLALRIGVRPGGCSGFQYSIYFDDEINDDDEVFETKGVKVVIDAMSVPYIMGSEFDYVDRSEEHTSELQSRQYLVCRLLLEKKKNEI